MCEHNRSSSTANASHAARWPAVALVLVLMLVLAQGTFYRPAGFIQGYTGYNSTTLSDNTAPSFSSFSDGTNFWTLFGVFFPAVTGVLQGAWSSWCCCARPLVFICAIECEFIVICSFAFGCVGDAGANLTDKLKKPDESIPKGTAWAIIFCSVVYIIVIVICGVCACCMYIHACHLARVSSGGMLRPWSLIPMCFALRCVGCVGLFACTGHCNSRDLGRFFENRLSRFDISLVAAGDSRHILCRAVHVGRYDARLHPVPVPVWVLFLHPPSPTPNQTLK